MTLAMKSIEFVSKLRARLYLSVTEDDTILDESISYLKGPILNPEQDDSYYTPEVSSEMGTVYDHCVRAIEKSLSFGVHDLPLMGSGDWNDGMNRVGHGGKGESIWLGWFLFSNLISFSKIAKAKNDIERAERWIRHAKNLRVALEKDGWDGDWYKRAYYDSGEPLGSKENSECKIDSLAQSWSVISGAAEKDRATRAMASVKEFLIKPKDDLVLLFTPPFDKTVLDPGYIKGYLPGVRENGGQYTHAAIWCIFAYAGLNDGRNATELFSMLNPINHSLNFKDAQKYKVEPYVIAADIYSEAPYNGRGGWTWYTGASGWLYRAGMESILGFNLKGNKLEINPHINPEWTNYKIQYRHRSSLYEIEVKNPNKVSFGPIKIKVDGVLVASEPMALNLVDDGAKHFVEVELGVRHSISSS